MASAFKGYQEKDLSEWKRTRLLGYYSMTPHYKEIKKPEDLFKLEGDFRGEKKLAKVRKLTKEEKNGKLVSNR